MFINYENNRVSFSEKPNINDILSSKEDKDIFFLPEEKSF
jgi:hypothetical protein